MSMSLPWRGSMLSSLLPIPISAFAKPRSFSIYTGNITQRQYDDRVLSQILDRKWVLTTPYSKIHEVLLSHAKGECGRSSSDLISLSSNLYPSLGKELKDTRLQDNSFYVVRDDLLHPLVSGNKIRKLDPLLPLIEAHSVTDVVTCGGCQSAHAAAVAVACAERGLQAHLVLRGERLEIPTGYNFISEMYGNVVYVPRSVYADREVMLERHATLIAGQNGSIMWLHDEVDLPLIPVENHTSRRHDGNGHLPGIATQVTARKVAIIKEGGGDAVALLGLIRLVDYLAQPSVFGRDQAVQIIVDSGTGTTAIGLALGIELLGLPWKVTGIMLADTIEGYKKREVHLLSDFKKLIMGDFEFKLDKKSADLVQWIERGVPRKFGKVLKGELELCRQIAQQTGILVDPVYTLASWEHAVHACKSNTTNNLIVIMLHTGGTLGLFGLAQRYKSYFPLAQESTTKPGL